MSKTKKITIVIWSTIVLTLLCLSFFFPDSFSAESIKTLIQPYEGYALLIFLILSIVRGLTLLPSTPFVIAGTLLFPNQLWMVFWISIIGITFCSILLYYFSSYLSFDKLFEKKFPKKIEFVKNKLNSPKGVLFVILWSFFPLVPTDLVCYVAGSIKMKFSYFITGILLGEIPLIYLYVFSIDFISQLF